MDRILTLTLEEVQNAAPANIKRSITQQMVDDVNNASSDPEIAKSIGDNFVSYVGVMKEGRFKIEDYIAAVTYVSYKLMGDSNKEAWTKTFPQRYSSLVAKGCTPKEISSHVASYSKGKLVNSVLEQSMVPSWVLNAHMFQSALNVQAELMKTANSEKVRSDAANSILTHLKRPEAVKGQLDVNINDNSGMNELRNILGEMALHQRNAIKEGVPIKTITNARLIESDEDEKEPEPEPILIEQKTNITENKKRESIFK